MIREVEQEAVGIGGFVVVNQASQHMVVEMVSVIIGIIRCQLIRAQACRCTFGFAIKGVPLFRVAVCVFDMRPQQMHDDELLRRGIGQHLLKRIQHVGVVLASALSALLVHIKLLVCLL